MVRSFNEDIDFDGGQFNSNITPNKKNKKLPKNLKLRNIQNLKCIFPYSRINQSNYEIILIPNLKFRKLKEIHNFGSNKDTTHATKYYYLDINFDNLSKAFQKLINRQNNQNQANLILPSFENLSAFAYDNTLTR